MSMQQYCLRWNNHQPNFISVFSSLLNSESLVDVTLSAEGRHLQAHKLVLSACSSYFQSLFTINPCQHPIVILKDVKFLDLKVIIDFMYYGEVNVSQDQLPHILKTAEMLKIKGLAEIPVEASVKQNNTSERTDLLNPTESSWGTVETQHRQSLSPSPCPLSPASKRKRLRKSSTGSGSGSTERATMEEHSGSEVTLTSPLGTAIIKPDPGGYADRKHSSESDLGRGSSHESVENDPPHQITLQIPQQEMQVAHNVEPATSMEMPGPSATTQTVTDRVIVSTHAQHSQSSQLAQSSLLMGTKRSRVLIRQSRIKREIEVTHDPMHHLHDTGGDPLALHTLTVPHVKVERQVSDPLPTHSPPSSGLLTVPNVLVKQHSHPLLPARTPHHAHSPPPMISGLQIHPIPLTHSDSDAGEGGDRPGQEAPLISLRARLEESSTSSSTLRVRADELKRSASSPTQTNTRSSHCPVVRPGPALGCNYCWNTVDTHGRILRRKTKYYCPECQTNLCIVPCFQEYHEQTDPTSMKTSLMRIFPKTSSM